jgi:hypothetical protein
MMSKFCFAFDVPVYNQSLVLAVLALREQNQSERNVWGYKMIEDVTIGYNHTVQYQYGGI